MENDTVLNVTLLDPRVKHPIIFKSFNDLAEGESFTIHNDHDPKPLYYHLLSQHGNIFTWQYLEEGPRWWKVKIAKRILGLGKETLGAIVTNDVRKAKVFKKYGLDYGNDGKKTLSNACKEKHLVVAQVENDLQAVEKKVSTKILPCNDWELNFLSDYIVNVHHHYVRTYLPKMQEYAQKVMKVHADRHPELYEINDLITAVGSDMMAHMEKEELRLFPLIKTLVSRSKEISAEKPISSKDFQNFIVMHEAEHASVGHEMKQIRKLTQNYTLPEDACASYIFLYMMMEEFEDDLQMHIHLENNILFPKALVLEDKLN